jgi:hypothetical protein
MKLADGAFPALDVALDAEATLDLLRNHYRRTADVSLRSVDVVDVRYEPGRRCELLYRLKGDDPLTGKGTRQLLAGRLVRVDEEPSHPPPALLDRYYAAAPTLIPVPWAFLDHVRLELNAHPVDAQLPWLFDALSSDHMAHRFERLWAARKLRVRSVALESLGYTPAARAAFAYEVLAESRSTREPELRRLIGKMHAKKPAARLFAGSWALWSAARGRVEFAPPVGFDAATNLTFQERVDGVRLGSLAKEGAFVRHVRRTAKYIARLHRLELPLATRRKPQEEAGVLQRWSTVLASIRPDLAPRLERLRADLAAELERRVELKSAVHGDFHHTNVLVAGDRVTIIDLDEMAFGDPLLDVGRFMASMRIPSLRAFGRIDALEPAREAFLKEYMLHNPEDERRARLFEAASLFTAAASAFRIQRPTWAEEVELLVDEAERVFTIAGGRASRQVSASPQELPAFTPTADPRSWVTDRFYMRAILAPEVERAYGVELGEVLQVTPSDDRERVEYTVSGWRDEERWKARLTASISQSGGAGALQRITAMREALAPIADAPVLPRPVGYVRSLSLVIFETARGRSLTSLFGRADAEELGVRLGRAMAAVHGTSPEIDRSRPLAREIDAVASMIGSGDEAGGSLTIWSRELHQEIVRRLASVREVQAPAVRPLQPQRILVAEKQIVFDHIEDVVLADPRYDLGELIARMLTAGMRQRATVAADSIVRSLRAAYDDAVGEQADANAGTVLESLALIRQAWAGLARGGPAADAEAVIRRASLMLGC